MRRSNLGLGAIYKNQIRPPEKLDSATVLSKLNHVDNDALVQLYYLLVLVSDGGKLEHRESETVCLHHSSFFKTSASEVRLVPFFIK